MATKYIHVCPSTIGMNNRKKTNDPVIIVIDDREVGDTGRRVQSVIIRDKDGNEVARVVQDFESPMETTHATCWIETDLDIEVAGERKVTPLHNRR